MAVRDNAHRLYASKLKTISRGLPNHIFAHMISIIFNSALYDIDTAVYVH